ncbi:MAG: hypothetical protein RLN90_15585 [Balneolaceae bacterium]
MKKITVLLFLGLLITQEVNAQSFLDKTFQTPLAINKVSSNLESSHLTDFSFKVNISEILPDKNSLLLSSLKVTEGLKFQSSLDQFSSMPLFDFRAYNPVSVSDYNDHLSRNYLMLNSSFPKIW